VASLVCTASLWIWVERYWGVLVMGPLVGLASLLLGQMRGGAAGWWDERRRKLEELAAEDPD
jgi:hypothetical protein